MAFDDNPVLTATGGPTPDDTTMVVSPALDLTFTGRHTHIGLGYNGALVRYRTLDEYDSFDQTAQVELRQQASKRVGLNFHNRYSVHPSTDAVQLVGVPLFRRVGTRRNEFIGGTTVQATRSLELTGSYHFQWLEFDRTDDPVSALLDGGTSHSFTLGALHAISGRVKVGGGYRYVHANVGEFRDVVDIQNGDAAVSVELSPTVTLDAGAGFSHVVLPEGLGARTGPAGRIALRKRTEYAQFSITAMRAFVPAFGFGNSLRTSEVSGSVRVPFRGTRGFVQGGAALRDSESLIETGIGVTSVWLETSVGYGVARWLRLEVFYDGAFQDTAEIAGGRIDRNRFGVRMVTLRPMRIQ
jgi:hypothetical protein